MNLAETSGNLGGSMVDSAFVFPMSLNLYNEFLDLVVKRFCCCLFLILSYFDVFETNL